MSKLDIKNKMFLTDSEKQLDNVINNIGDPLFVKNEQSQLLIVNDAFCKMFGRSKADIIGKTLADDIDPEEQLVFSRIDKLVLANGIENVNEANITIRGGETRIISTKKTRYLDNSGTKYLVGVIRDITEKKKAEVTLLDSEYNLRQSQIVANIGSYVFDINSVTWKSSEVLDSIFGLNESFIKSYEGWVNIVHPDDREELINYFENNVLKNHEKFNKEYRIIKVDTKKEVWVLGLGELEFDNDGNPVKMFGTIQDISKRKRAELEFRAAKDFSDKLIMSMQEGLLIVNIEGKIIMVNDSFCKVLGYSREELIGHSLPYPFALIDDLDEIKTSIKRIVSGEDLSLEFEFIKKNEERFIASFTTGNIKNDTGEIIALFGTMKDISERVKAQKLLEDTVNKSTQKKDVILKLAGLVGEGFEDSLEKIVKEASETLNIERVSIWSFNSDKTEFYCEQLFVSTGNLSSKGGLLRQVDNPNYFDALYKYRTLLVTDVLKDPITEKFAKDYLIPNKIASLMDVFIHSTTGYYGIICFEHVGDLRIWTAEEQEFAISIASIVSLMVESMERKVAETKTTLANQKLTQANIELNTLRNQLEQENVYLRNELDLVFNYEEMVYGSSAFSNVLTEVEKVAPTTATVLLLGESGTGKELLARAIHKISLRNKKPLIKVNCSAIPRELIESELFGHRKGSFTGAFGNKIGKFELADGGTLFLDEIGELPLDMQPKILRFLQEGEIEVVGGVGLKTLDVRVIAATNRNLKEEIAKKQFREDLYFRLNVFPIEVPPLRKRKDDIPLLVEHFVEKFNKVYGKNIIYISDDAMNQLKSYDWPGNIRELENLIERAIILSNNSTLLIPGFETSAQKSRQLINYKDSSLHTVQRNHIIIVLDQCNWKISGPNGAAVLLDLKASTLRDKMTKLGIKKPITV